MTPPTSVEVASLGASISWWEWIEYTAEAGVILGCVGEYIASFTRISTESLRHKFGLASLLFLTASLAVELTALVNTNRLSGKEIALLNGIAADVRKDNLVLQAHILKLQGAMDERKVEAEKLEERTRTRYLDPQQRRRIETKLRRFAGQEMNLFGYVPDSEIERLATDVISALGINFPESAQWKITVSTGNDVSPRRIVGIEVLIKPDANEASRIAAVSLVDALRSEGLMITGPKESAVHLPPVAPNIFNGTLNPKTPITIIIGKRTSDLAVNR